MAEQTLPNDHFSRRLRELTSNPGAVRSTSTVQLEDFLGNAETWVVETFRVEGGKVEVLLQRIGADGGTRLVLPPKVVEAMMRGAARGVTVVRRRAARTAVETKRAAGQRIGNPEAFRKARSKKR